MKEEKVEYFSSGRAFAGWFFESERGATPPRAGVALLHGGAGFGTHERERAQMLADLGYVVFAPDLFGEVFESRERGVSVITGLVEDPRALRDRLGDALACLRQRSGVDESRVAAIGFCFGGLAALELARSGADVRAVVAFHGGLTTRAPARAGEVRASILVCTGADDPFVTREHRGAFEDEMTAARADWQLQVHANAAHGFTERNVQRPGVQYHEATDRRTWQAMRLLFDERLENGGLARGR